MSADNAQPELKRLTAALQHTLELSLNVNASSDELAAMTSQLNKLNQDLQAHQGQKLMPYYNANAGERLQDILPYGPATGAYNAYSPDIDVELEGNKVVSTVTFGWRHEGPPNSVHGGIISLLFDQLLAFACLNNNTPGYTASLQVSYRKPLPLFRELRFTTWLENIGEKKVVALGECYDGDTLLASSEGLFIRII